MHVYIQESGEAQKYIRPGERRQLGTLIRIHNFRRAELMDGLVQRINAKSRLKRVRDAPCQNLACVPVHNRDQI